jgi:photosystem II stability/assembly factor-like uncharacterized protein
MAGRHRMYVGSEAGVTIFEDEGGAWRQAGLTLEGKRATVLRASEDGTLYAAVPEEGVYASADGGRAWDLSLKGDVRSLCVDPTNPATVYAGTEPIRLFRTTDAGDHWTEIQGLQRMPEAVR